MLPRTEYKGKGKRSPSKRQPSIFCSTHRGRCDAQGKYCNTTKGAYQKQVKLGIADIPYKCDSCERGWIGFSRDGGIICGRCSAICKPVFGKERIKTEKLSWKGEFSRKLKS